MGRLMRELADGYRSDAAWLAGRLRTGLRRVRALVGPREVVALLGMALLWAGLAMISAWLPLIVFGAGALAYALPLRKLFG